MPNWTVIDYRRLPRNRSIGVLFDTTRRGNKCFAVAVAYRGVTYWISDYYDSDTAHDLAEEYALCFHGPEGDSSWLAVLARLQGKPEQEAWEGSDAQKAALCYPTGTWNWLSILSQIKSQTCH